MTKKKRINTFKKMLLTGIGLGVLFWFFEAAVHAFVFHEGHLLKQLFLPAAHEFWMRSFGTGILIAFGAYAQFMITKYEKAREEIKFTYAELNQIFNTLTQIFNTAADGMRVIDTNFTILMANDTFADLAGLGRKEIIGRKCFDVFHGSMCHTAECPLVRILRGEKHIECDVEKERENGMKIPCIVTATPFLGTNGEIIGIVEDFKDIAERNKAKIELLEVNKKLLESNEKLRKLTLKDSLTGLYNHRFLETAMEAEFSRAKRYDYPLSVIMIDIDYFKSINDVYGHPFGDTVLRQLSRRLKQAVRKYDVVVRFGGEEFLIISPLLNKEKAVSMAERILRIVESNSFGDEKHTVKLKISLAVASYPENRITKSMDLIECADQILGKVKEDGGNRIYSSVDDSREKHDDPQKSEKEDSDVVLLKSKIDKLTKRANQGLVEAIFAFAKTIELKDHYTGTHVEKTVYYAVEIAKALNLSQEDLECVRKASRLHDLGKVGISESILLKPAKLTDEEFEEIKKHPQIGVDIIRLIQSLRDIIPLILHHQERWDGKGYPAGLKGEEIPLGARIIALADVYQALISDRPYRKAYSKAKAEEIIKEGSSSHFDPYIVDVFLKILHQEFHGE